ncbi:MAG: leucine-rich repeat domain-containing protein [Clostridia bacterium]
MNNAFYGCINLINITLSESLISIGNYTFMNCSKLTTIIIPENVKSIGDYVFYNCKSLTIIIMCIANSNGMTLSDYWNDINDNYDKIPVTWGYKEE